LSLPLGSFAILPWPTHPTADTRSGLPASFGRGYYLVRSSEVPAVNAHLYEKPKLSMKMQIVFFFNFVSTINCCHATPSKQQFLQGAAMLKTLEYIHELG
jgi:hypothetical protein